MKTIHIVCILCLVLVSCTNMKLQDAPYIPNEELAESYENFNDSFKKTRSSLSYIGGHIATDCQTYFDLTSMYEIDETIHNQSVKSEYLICDALNILSSSTGVPRENVNISSMGEALLIKLDLRSFSSSLYRASDENSHTLKSLYPQNTSSVGNIAELNAEDWTFTLEVVAVAKINDNSSPDWVIWVLDESKSGNYRGYSTLIIYDPERHESFKAIAYPK
ncbi:MAG TPA: hypothetical protein DD412_05400 [Holosporales bacterium]|nr:hypothetical protein [Holosporales bacterium]